MLQLNQKAEEEGNGKKTSRRGATNTYATTLDNAITNLLNQKAEKGRNEKRTSRKRAINTYTIFLDNSSPLFIKTEIESKS